MDKITARFCVVWIEDDRKKIRVEDVETRRHWHDPLGAKDDEHWTDPIGASYMQWRKMTDKQRANLMVETLLDLALQGYNLGAMVREFAKVDCFYDLGRQSMPMCRVLTSALLGKCLEPNTMTFDELMANYSREDA